MPVLVDGDPVDPAHARLSVFDHALLRGDGCFEVMRSYRGVAFQVGAHLARLVKSAAALELALPEPDVLLGWVRRVAADGGDGLVRVVVTRGGDDPQVATPPRVVVMWQPLPVLPAVFRLKMVEAPWHPAGAPWELVGAKTLSYAPNLAAGRLARRAGFDDAILVGRGGVVLEGPTFSLMWAAGGRLHTPSLELGILASITRAVVMEEAGALGLEVVEGRFPTSAMIGAEEVMVLSTVREVRPVVAVDDTAFPPGPVTALLAKAFAGRVAGGVTS